MWKKKSLRRQKLDQEKLGGLQNEKKPISEKEKRWQEFEGRCEIMQQAEEA